MQLSIVFPCSVLTVQNIISTRKCCVFSQYCTVLANNWLCLCKILHVMCHYFVSYYVHETGVFFDWSFHSSLSPLSVDVIDIELRDCSVCLYSTRIFHFSEWMNKHLLWTTAGMIPAQAKYFFLWMWPLTFSLLWKNRMRPRVLK